MRRHPGKSISEYLRKQIPELAELEEAELRSVPETAPALWARDKLPGDTPPAFIERHYSNCLGYGLTRTDIRHLDLKLYIALDNWLHTNELPKGFDLPTIKERNDRWVDQINRGEGSYIVRTTADAFNLVGYIQRRKQAETAK